MWTSWDLHAPVTYSKYYYKKQNDFSIIGILHKEGGPVWKKMSTGSTDIDGSC